MKNRELIEESILLLDCYTTVEQHKLTSIVIDVRRKLTEFLVGNELSSTIKVGKFDLFKCCSKNEMRPTLTGIYHDPLGFKVASDGHILGVLMADIPADMQCKIITKKGRSVEGMFPNYRAVIPPYESGDRLDNFRENIKQYREQIKLLKVEQKITTGPKFINIKNNSGDTSYFTHKFFSIFLDFMEAFPLADAYIGNGSGNKPLVAKDKEGNLLLLMNCDVPK